MIRIKKRTLVNIAVLILLIGITFYCLLHGKDLRGLIGVVRRADLRFISLGVLLMFGFIFGEAWCMHIILKSLNSHVSLGKCMKYSFIGFYFSAITPSASGGQPMQAFYMNSDRISIAHSGLTLLLITIVYKSVLLLFGGFLFLFQPALLEQHLGLVKYVFLVGLLINLLFIAFLIVVVFSKRVARFLVEKAIRFLAWIHILKHPERTLEHAQLQLSAYHEGAAYFKSHPGLVLEVTGITILQRCSMFLVTYCIYRALGLHRIGPWEILLLQSVVAIAVDMLPVPGGVGASEPCFLEVFAYAFPSQLLIPGLLLSRGISYYGFVLISGIVVIVAQIRHIRKSKKRET